MYNINTYTPHRELFKVYGQDSNKISPNPSPSKFVSEFKINVTAHITTYDDSNRSV